MKTEMVIPYGLSQEMEDDIFDYGMHLTEYIAGAIHQCLISGAFKNEIFLHADVRMT